MKKKKLLIPAYMCLFVISVMKTGFIQCISMSNILAKQSYSDLPASVTVHSLNERELVYV